jgi:signal transduction histidine kinase
MKWFPSLVLSWFCSLIAFSQETDSLIRALRSDRMPDTTRVLTLVRVSFQISEAKPDSAFTLALQAESLAKEIGYTKGLGRANRGIGRYYFVRGDFEKAATAFQKASEFCRLANDKRGEANAQVDLGSTYKNLGNYAESSDCNFRGISLYESLGRNKEKQAISAAYVNLAVLFKDLRVYEKSFQYLDSARRMKLEVNDRIGLGRIYSNLGALYSELDNVDKSNEYLEMALQISNEVDAKELKSFVLCDMVNNLIKSGNLQHAQEHLDNARALAAEINSGSRMTDVLSIQANLYYQKGQAQLALTTASESEKLARSIGSPMASLQALKIKYKSYEMLGLHKEALGSYKQWVSLNDSLKNDPSWRQALMREYNLKEEKIVLEQEKKDLEHVAAEAKQQVLINSIAGFAFTVSVIFVLVLMSNKRIKKQRNEILKSKEELARQRDLLTTKNKELEVAHKLIEDQNLEISSRNELLEIEVQKRTHELLEYNQQLEQFAFATAHHLRAPVARILGLGNILNMGDQPTAEIKVISTKMAETSRELDQVVNEINSIVRSHRDITANIHTLSLEEEFRKIKYLLRKEIKDTGAEIIENFDRVGVTQTVPQHFQSIFFHLLTNALKFRNPQRALKIHIVSQRLENFVLITVTDNGLGIDLNLFGEKIFNIYSRFHTHVEGRGLGLYLVKTQLSMMGGRIEVESNVNCGAEFRVYLKV